MYTEGLGVPQDFALAHMWYNIAAAMGLDDTASLAADARDALASRMTPEQIYEAQLLARAWMEDHEP